MWPWNLSRDVQCEHRFHFRLMGSNPIRDRSAHRTAIACWLSSRTKAIRRLFSRLQWSWRACVSVHLQPRESSSGVRYFERSLRAINPPDLSHSIIGLGCPEVLAEKHEGSFRKVLGSILPQQGIHPPKSVYQNASVVFVSSGKKVCTLLRWF
jgi:hypothetical protein